MSSKQKLWRKVIKIFKTIVFIIITATVLLSLIINILKRNIKTTLPEEVELIDSIISQGIIIKNENLIRSSNGGYIDFIVEEGERVPSGKKILVVNTLNDMKTLEYELNEIDESINLIESSGIEDEKIVNENKAYESKDDLLSSLQEKIKLNDFENITFIKNQLIAYDIDKENLDFTGNSKATTLENLKDRKSNIALELNQNSIAYYSNSGGIISFEIDGYEEIYLPEHFENYTFENFEINEIPKTSRDKELRVNENEAIFKIIDNFQWYMAIKIEDLKEITELKVNRNIKIQIEDSQDELDGNITNINISGDKAVIVASFNTMFHEYYKLRYPKVEIIKQKISGYKIPKNAIVNINNVKGLYIKDRSGIVRFKPILIFEEDNNYAYIYAGDDSSNIKLKNNSETVKTVNLFDEIIVNPINITEGDIL